MSRTEPAIATIGRRPSCSYGTWNTRHGTDAALETAPLHLNPKTTPLGGDRFAYYAAVEEVDGAFGMVSVARVVGDHADGGAIGVEFF
jgi:hypothetical protein